MIRWRELLKVKDERIKLLERQRDLSEKIILMQTKIIQRLKKQTNKTKK